MVAMDRPFFIVSIQEEESKGKDMKENLFGYGQRTFLVQDFRFTPCLCGSIQLKSCSIINSFWSA